jgi:hypothetical protein
MKSVMGVLCKNLSCQDDFSAVLFSESRISLTDVIEFLLLLYHISRVI